MALEEGLLKLQELAAEAREGEGDTAGGGDVVKLVVDQMAAAVLSTPADSAALAGERALQRAVLFELDDPPNLMSWVRSTMHVQRLADGRVAALELVRLAIRHWAAGAAQWLSLIHISEPTRPY